MITNRQKASYKWGVDDAFSKLNQDMSLLGDRYYTNGWNNGKQLLLILERVKRDCENG